MRFTKKIPYQLKTLIPALGIAGASLFVACKPHNEPDISGKPTTTDTITNTPAKKHNIELYFKRGDISHIRIDTIKYYLSKPDVDTVFIVPDNKTVVAGGFQESPAPGISASLRQVLENTTNVDSTRVWGRGDIGFVPGITLPEDSLWFVSRGWTINKYLQNQR